MNPNSSPNLIHRKGEFSSAAIGKSRKKTRLALGEDMLHPVKQFKKIEFKERNNATVEYCQEFISHIGSVNCSG